MPGGVSTLVTKRAGVTKHDGVTKRARVAVRRTATVASQSCLIYMPSFLRSVALSRDAINKKRNHIKMLTTALYSTDTLFLSSSRVLKREIDSDIYAYGLQSLPYTFPKQLAGMKR